MSLIDTYRNNIARKRSELSSYLLTRQRKAIKKPDRSKRLFLQQIL